MEIHRRKSSSGDKFSFPIIPVQDQDFEFGCVTPGSPNSTADRLFFNGILLPHAFPCQPTNNVISFSRSTSRTSSVCSKDSLMSSRSNSTNSSRSSSCSSARTSTSEAAGPCTSDSKLFSNNQTKIAGKNPVEKDLYQATRKPVLTPHYGSSQRWQFIAPAPAMMHQVSRARKAKISVRDQVCKSKKQGQDWTIARRTWFGLKFLRAVASACKECHAVKPSSRKCFEKK